MKICHVTCAHYRHDVRICEKECVSLARKGYDTYLVVNDEELDEEYKGVHIISTGKRSVNRIQRFFYSPKVVLKKALEVDAEIYHLHDPELLTIVRKFIKAGKKVIFDAHEDTEKQIISKSYIPRIFRGMISHLYSRYFQKKCQIITALITVTPSIFDKLKKYNERIELITNYPILVDEDIKGCYVSQEPYIFFAGGVEEQWSHENIIFAIKNIPNIKYFFAGKGEKSYINSLLSIGEKGRYLGMLPHDEVIKYYRGAIAGMALAKSTTQVGKQGTLGNTKLFEVMQSGRPVICSDLQLWRNIIEKYNCGICADSDDILSIEEAIKYLICHPDECIKMGENGKRAISDEYNWETQEIKLYALYKRIEDLL